jgi:hypothetical protein
MPLAKQLIFHGSVVLLWGLLCGAPYARALIRARSEVSTNAWRVAHLSLPIAGILLFALAGVVPQLRLSGSVAALMVWSFIASSYAFALALTLGAHYGFRGLSSRPSLLNRVVYAGNMAGAVLSLLGSIVLVWGAYAAL